MVWKVLVPNAIMSFRFPFLKKKKADHFVLVISGGGMRGFYGLGILKALEEKGLKNRIKAIYGVSAGGLLASYRAAGYQAEEILESFLHSPFLQLSKNLNLIPKSSLLKTTLLKKQLLKELPKTFEELKIPVYIGCSEVKKGEYLILSSGDLVSALLGTIAIPGIFPTMEREGQVLMDGGVTNNFPVEIAKEQFPKAKIIGISLNKYRTNPKIKNLIDNVMIAFEIMLRTTIKEKWELCDLFFCRSLDTPILEFDKKKLKKLFELGYEDGKEEFQTKNSYE